MTKRQDRKRTLVTCAARGVGAATTRAFAREGAVGLATDPSAKKLAGLSSVAGFPPVMLDVTDGAGISRSVEHSPPFDILFNCAGLVHHGYLLECSDEGWDEAFDVKLKSMFRISRAVLPGHFFARQPMGWLGTPAAIASAAVYLASDEPVSITGTLLTIDGGMSI